MNKSDITVTKMFLSGLKEAEKAGMDFEFCLSFFDDILKETKVKEMNEIVGQKERQFQESITHANREWDI